MLHIEAHVVGRRERAEATGEVAARYGYGVIQPHLRHSLGNARTTAGAAAEQVHERVFEPGRYDAQCASVSGGESLQLRAIGAIAKHDPNGAALNDAIAHAGQVERL